MFDEWPIKAQIHQCEAMRAMEQPVKWLMVEVNFFQPSRASNVCTICGSQQASGFRAQNKAPGPASRQRHPGSGLEPPAAWPAPCSFSGQPCSAEPHPSPDPAHSMHLNLSVCVKCYGAPHATVCIACHVSCLVFQPRQIRLRFRQQPALGLGSA